MKIITGNHRAFKFVDGEIFPLRRVRCVKPVKRGLIFLCASPDGGKWLAHYENYSVLDATILFPSQWTKLLVRSSEGKSELLYDDEGEYFTADNSDEFALDEMGWFNLVEK